MKNYGDIIDAAVILQAKLTSIEQSLTTLRRDCEGSWKLDIVRDKRPAVQILWDAYQDATTDLAMLRAQSIMPTNNVVRAEDVGFHA